MTQRRPDNDPLVPRWAWLFVAGPIIWYVYFWVAYLAAEAGCTANSGAMVTWLTIGLTVGTMVVIGYYTWRARRDERAHATNISELIKAGFLMGGFFVLATLFVGIPAVALQPC